MYESIVARNIKSTIENRCLKQGAIARKAGYDIKKFSNMLNGRKIITDVDIVNVANALGVTPGELFQTEEDE